MPKKEKQGVVVGNSMNKTVVVNVCEYEAHKKYKKITETTKKYKAHDENNECSVGDVVRIVESKPISSGKFWKMVQIVEKAK